MALVRGAPFAGSDYDWPEGELLIHEMEKAIVDTADRMATVARELGRPDRAGLAIRQGLAGLRYPDQRLLVHRLDIGASESAAGLIEAWREVTARLDAADDAPSQELVDLYDRLRGQLRG